MLLVWRRKKTKTGLRPFGSSAHGRGLRVRARLRGARRLDRRRGLCIAFLCKLPGHGTTCA
eukprot:1596888-Lingulodinium_polyedra.AAC.1